MTAPTTTSGAVYDEMKDFEKRCNERCTPLNAYLVLYEAVNNDNKPVVKKTVMICPSPTHVVVRFPSAVKIELLSDGVVSISPVIAQELQEEIEEPEGDGADVPQPNPAPAPVPVPAPIQTPPIAPQTPPVQAQGQRNIPLLPGLRLCKVCKFSPFNDTTHACTSVPKGHRFDKDPATKRCEQFQFP